MTYRKPFKAIYERAAAKEATLLFYNAALLLQMDKVELIGEVLISILAVNINADYARRAGIERTISEGIRTHGLRHARYIGLAKTHLQHLMIATAVNFKRIFHWLSGIPQATTRTSQFAKLMAQSVG